MKQYELFELTYKAAAPEGSFVDVDLTAVFTCNENNITVKGFYAGDETYKIRFYPAESGKYTITVSGIIEDSMEIECETSKSHGMVRAFETHFKYDDGTWFYPFGTTVYGLVNQNKELIDETMDTLRDATFNKIRFCVFPKHYDYNHNDPEFYPFEGEKNNWDTSHPCFAYWDHLEERIVELDQMGIQCDLIVFHPYDRWGFADLTPEQRMEYLEYATRRLSAFPNLWWSMANEYDIMKWSMEDWRQIEEKIASSDPFGHLLSNHQMIEPWNFDSSNITHICTQIKNVDNIKYDIHVHNKPMMVDECRYEGNIQYEWGNISGFEMVNRFWKVMMQGGYCTHGETFFSDDEILWWSRGGKLKGESPKRIAFLHELADSLPGPIHFYGKTLTAAEIEEQVKNPTERTKSSPLYNMMTRLTPEAILILVNQFAGFIGAVGDNDVIIKYYETQNTVLGEMDLPGDTAYDVEVIDAWNMTREKVLENVSGKVNVSLPGREGMALMATKCI